MAYYDALKAAWNNPTQPPPGVTGTGLSAGMSTEIKLGHVNAWTVTGAVPTSFYTTGNEVFNCIAWSEFNALQAARQTSILNMLNVPGALISGTDNADSLIPGVMLSSFAAGTKTRTALIALAKAITQTWCKANGYPENPNGGGGLTMIDVQAAGLS